MARIDIFEAALARAFRRITASGAPPRLRTAMRRALFPGGARMRPRLVLAVTGACGGDVEVALHGAVAVELIHCASLVHDDLPCFDNAATRRGRPSIHAEFGEPLAVLVGDGLIVAAFAELARGAASHAGLAPSVAVLANAVGAAGGLVAGQAWEAEPEPDLGRYHRAKTGALFEAAVCLGALAAGADPQPWRSLGSSFGEAYQIADDILDRVATSAEIGKPVGQDRTHARPSAVEELGLDRARARLLEVQHEMQRLVPPCMHGGEIRTWLADMMTRLVPPAASREGALGYASMSA